MGFIKISIIIPTYNRGHIIADTIQSVQAQSYKQWELIVVDDGSTDNTENIVNKFRLTDNRVIYVKRPKHKPKGANACRNYGFDIASGEYIKWLDSDDILQENCLGLQLEKVLNDQANVNLCFAQYFTNSGGDFKLMSKRWCNILESSNITSDLIISRLQWQTATGLWKKAFFNETPFDERIQNSQEWLFNIKMSLSPALKISTLHESLVFIRKHNNSMSDESNKKGKYYFSAARARYLALEMIRNQITDKKIINYLIKKMLWYQIFTLYKGYPSGFIKLVRYWPKIAISMLS